MEAGHVTPRHGPDRVEQLERQHLRDLDALDNAADVIAGQEGVIAIRDARIASLEREQAILLYLYREH